MAEDRIVGRRGGAKFLADPDGAEREEDCERQDHGEQERKRHPNRTRPNTQDHASRLHFAALARVGYSL